jgi:outer membrane biosynthesis protein TonB
MLAVSSGDREFWTELNATRGTRADRFSRGLMGSLTLHVLAALLILFGLPSLLQTPPETARIVPIDLVKLGTKTASPPAEEKAAVPQEQAAMTATEQPIDPVPVPQAPPPSQARPLKLADRPKPEAPAAPKPQKQPAPPLDDLNARLQSLARLRQPTAPLPPNPRTQEGSGISSTTASSDAAALGPQASYSVKDFIRAQVERHWYLDKAALRAGAAAVSIHMLVNRDGSVGKAEIVDDPRFDTDTDLYALALSARNAVLLSSPLTLPPGRYDDVKDMVLEFDPRKALR